MFVSFDGVDGAGKSTQIELFLAWLRASGRDPAACRDPGSTPLGEALRGIVLGHATPLDLRAEMLVYMAARAQLTAELIRPALLAGKIVVSDRYLLANVVYQGHAGGLDVQDLWEVGKIATGGLSPDLTFVLDLPVEAAAKRRTDPPDRMESRGLEFHERVRQGFLTEAARLESVLVVDANRTADAIQEDIRSAFTAALKTFSA